MTYLTYIGLCLRPLQCAIQATFSGRGFLLVMANNPLKLMHMIKKFFTPILLAFYLISSGCAFLAAGAGTGAAVYTYKCGELKKFYQASFDKTIAACNAALKSLKINVTEKTPPGVTAVIKGKSADNKLIEIKIVMITDKITQISVRSGHVGVWNKKRSELIHASIAQRL